MSEFQPTESQKRAIQASDRGILISAGAGSGKTRVITERLMRYLLDSEHPRDISEFVIITFTQAAAAELKGRIAQEIAQAAAKYPEREQIRRQTVRIRNANIGTIHHFCGELLRENGHLLGIPSDFKIMTEERGDAMRISLLDRLLNQKYETLQSDPQFEQLVNSAGIGRDDRLLAELVLELYKKMQSHARPEVWARNMLNEISEAGNEIEKTTWGMEILQKARKEISFWSKEMKHVLEESKQEEKIYAAYGESIRNTGDALDELKCRLNSGWDKAFQFSDVPFERLKILRNSPDPALSEWIKDQRSSCKSAVEKIQKQFRSPSKEMMQELKSTEPAMKALLELTLELEEMYSSEKRKAGILDYSDLEHLTAQLLMDENKNRTPLAESISQRYQEIMVDEFQDVSEVQDEIFQAVSKNEKNLFVVGDIKQSIYGFRLADPKLFLNRLETFQTEENCTEKDNEKIFLQENFRSREEIICGVNAVFSTCMTKALGGVNYSGEQQLVFGAKYFEGTGDLPELILLPPKSRETTEESDSEEENNPGEAEFVASEIEKLLASGMKVTEGDKRRLLEPGDIAILLRSVNKSEKLFHTALKNRNIPVVSAQGGGFFETKEISDLLSFLKVLDNPHQDIPLIAALRSPLYHFSPDELAGIRAADENHDLYSGLAAAAKTNPKAKDCLENISVMRRAATEMAADTLVWHIISGTDVQASYGAMPAGEQRIANLMQLVQYGVNFENDGRHGLHEFVLYLEQLATKPKDTAITGGETSAVQIMSIHKSKGLEYPIIFLCDTARKFNMQDMRSTVLIHPNLGLGFKYVDQKRRAQYSTVARSAIAERLREETLSEEMRLLYVAMTRAKERLYITASMEKPEEKIEKLERQIQYGTAEGIEHYLSNAPSFVYWVLAAAVKNCGKDLRIRLADSVLPGTILQSEEAKAEPKANPRAEEKLKTRLAFIYSHAAAVQMPSKITATELKQYESIAGNEEVPEPEATLLPKKPHSFRAPDFHRMDRPATGTERGIATHLMLQYLDFSIEPTKAAVERERRRLREKEFLSERQMQAVDIEKITKLLNSPLGKRIRNAYAVHREFRFSLLCDAGRLLKEENAGGEKILLQGIVDCCLEENGELVVIDYKTDRVKEGEETRRRAESYRPQVEAYAEAMSRVFQKKVKETVLYFLSSGEQIVLA